MLKSILIQDESPKEEPVINIFGPRPKTETELLVESHKSISLGSSLALLLGMNSKKINSMLNSNFSQKINGSHAFVSAWLSETHVRD